MVAKASNAFWGTLGKLADIIQIYSTLPVITGIAWIAGMLSQNVPIISAFGLFGMFVSGLAAFLILSLAVWLQSKAKGRNRRAIRTEESKFSRLVTWKGWRWVVFVACIVIGLRFLELRPRLPVWISPKEITLPIASYREMRKEKIVGKTVIISELPRGTKSTVTNIGEAMTIKGKVFEHCNILGSASLALVGYNEFNQCSFGFYQDREAILLEIHSKYMTAGMLALTNCTFIKCNFEYICFAGTKEVLDNMRKNMPIRD